VEDLEAVWSRRRAGKIPHDGWGYLADKALLTPGQRASSERARRAPVSNGEKLSSEEDPTRPGLVDPKGKAVANADMEAQRSAAKSL